MAVEIPRDTPLSDRDLLLHLVAHVEEIAEQVAAMHDALEHYGPVLRRFAPGGPAPNLIGIMQTVREGRRAARNGQQEHKQ